MKKTDTEQQTYETLRNELDTIMAELVREDLDVDVALANYERGLELVSRLEKHLKTASNRVIELKAKYNSSQI